LLDIAAHGLVWFKARMPGWSFTIPNVAFFARPSSLNVKILQVLRLINSPISRYIGLFLHVKEFRNSTSFSRMNTRIPVKSCLLKHGSIALAGQKPALYICYKLIDED
jgi:hypothetical protein